MSHLRMSQSGLVRLSYDVAIHPIRVDKEKRLVDLNSDGADFRYWFMS